MKKIVFTAIMLLIVSAAQSQDQKIPSAPGEELYLNEQTTLLCIDKGIFDFTVLNKNKSDTSIVALTIEDTEKRDFDETVAILARNRIMRGGDSGLRKAFNSVFTNQELNDLKGEDLGPVLIWNNEGNIIFIALRISNKGKLKDMEPQKIADLLYEITENVKFLVVDDRLKYYHVGPLDFRIFFDDLLTDKSLLGTDWRRY